MNPQSPRILHELPGRLRLGLADLDGELPVALLAAQPGVLGVRFNPAARCLVLDYEPDPRLRRRLLALILAALADLQDANLSGGQIPDPRPVVRATLDQFLLPLLPAQPRLALSIGRIGLRYARAARAVLKDGEGAEVLHGLILSRLVAMGRIDLATQLDLLMAVGRYLYQLRSSEHLS